jgi:hypothetical protein
MKLSGRDRFFQAQLFLNLAVSAFAYSFSPSCDNPDFDAVTYDPVTYVPVPTTPVRYPRSFRIFDIILYHNEAQMLYIRLRTLLPYVDIHYIGFSTLSFSHNIVERLSFAPLESELQSLSHRWHWMNYTHPSSKVSAWEREEDIRLRLIEQMIENEQPTAKDLVIWSDLDEIPLPRGMEWVIAHPPRHFYRFLGYMFFYNYRRQSPDDWQWAYIMRYGAKKSTLSWFKERTPDHPPFHYVLGAKKWGPGTQSLFHCSYCFPSLAQIISKLKSFSHNEFAEGQYIDPNYIYAYVYCGHSLFKGQYKLVDFEPMGLEIPDDPRFNFLRLRLSFNDLDQYQFNITRMKEFAPCKLDFLVGGDQVSKLPNHLT